MAEIEQQTQEKEKVEQTIEKLEHEKAGINLEAKKQYDQDREKWNRLSTLANKELSDLNRDLKFFSESDECDRCHQEIDPSFKEQSISKMAARKKKVETAIKNKIEPGLQSAIDGLSYVQTMSQKIIDLTHQIVEQSSQLTTLESQISKLQTSLTNDKGDSHISEKRKELGHYKASLTKLINKRIKMQGEADEYEVILKLLHDDGIKKNIIKMYIPIINKLISKYLSILGFPIKFTFDESFKEHIVVKGRRDLTYSSFSAGEKMRVDLALLFAFREIPIIRSGNSCNLLIFDEVADSAMDSDGWDSFLTIINSISDVGNVFVISPRGDVLVDKFSRSLSFIKKGPFSALDMAA